MKFTLLLVALLFVSAAFCQDEFEDKILIDAFTDVSNTIVILIPAGGVGSNDPALTQSNFATGANILGTERDLQLIVDSGLGNVVLTTGCSDGVYTSATPNSARGGSILTLDGIDSDLSIDASGLFGEADNDWTFEEGYALRTHIESDQATQVEFDVYSGSTSSYCSYTLNVPAAPGQPFEYIMEYDDWERTGAGCDFSNVGALQVIVVMLDNVDVIIGEITTYGPVSNCVCICPIFSCQINYELTDDTFSYYRSSQFGVFNPTTDFSTINGPPPPNPSATRSPLPPGVSASPRPDDSSDTSFTFSFGTVSNGSPSSSSDANIVSYSVFAIAALLAMLI